MCRHLFRVSILATLSVEKVSVVELEEIVSEFFDNH